MELSTDGRKCDRSSGKKRGQGDDFIEFIISAGGRRGCGHKGLNRTLFKIGKTGLGLTFCNASVTKI